MFCFTFFLYICIGNIAGSCVLPLANMDFMLKNIILFLKGFSMGLANVVPGVSGGTIALLAGIFERFINALKSFDMQALRLLFKGEFREFAKHTDLLFLVVLMSGELISIFTASRLLEYLFTLPNGDIYVWSFFFGLIIASVYYIGKTIKKINVLSVVLMLVGAALAYGTSIVAPASENDNIFYLIFCGAIAICDMLLPGISGSYTLILLGNYKLIMIDAVAHLRLEILLPVAAGCAIGFLAFSRFLSWLLKNHWDTTLSVLTGFIFGSLIFIWPWKKGIPLEADGVPVLTSHGKPVFVGYDYYLPDFTTQTFIAIAILVMGIVTLCVIEELSKRKGKESDKSGKANDEN